jgi:hypothetical protein
MFGLELNKHIQALFVFFFFPGFTCIFLYGARLKQMELDDINGVSYVDLVTRGSFFCYQCEEIVVWAQF